MAKLKEAREAIKEINARRNSGGGGGLFFKIGDGEKATVRILVDEPEWVWVHELPQEDGKFGKTEVCRDQDVETGSRTGEPCPGCDKQTQKEYRRKMLAKVPIIWRDGPVYEEVEDEKGNKRKNYDKVVGKADTYAIWQIGRVLIEELDGLHATFGPLDNRDYTVKRTGKKLDTVYDVKPVVVDGETLKTPLSEKDEEIKANVPELVISAPSYEDWGESANRSNSAPATVDTNPFKKMKKDE